MKLQKGDIVVCVSTGSYGKPCPAVVVQSDLFNSSHASVVICPITSYLVEAPLFRLALRPTAANGLTVSSQIMVDKLAAIKVEKITQQIGKLTASEIKSLDDALKLWLGII